MGFIQESLMKVPATCCSRAQGRPLAEYPPPAPPWISTALKDIIIQSSKSSALVFCYLMSSMSRCLFSRQHSIAQIFSLVFKLKYHRYHKLPTGFFTCSSFQGKWATAQEESPTPVQSWVRWKVAWARKCFFLARNGLWQECWQHWSPYTWLDESLVFQLARFNYQEYQGLQHCSHHLKTLRDHKHDHQDGLPSQWSLISHLLLDQLLLEKRPDLLEPQFLVKYRLVKH